MLIATSAATAILFSTSATSVVASVIIAFLSPPVQLLLLVAKVLSI